jgi:hypothetical protein
MYFSTFLCFFIFNLNHVNIATNSNPTNYKSDYYAALSSVDTVKINKQIAIIYNSQITEKKAYIGTLLMKKAGLVSAISNKLNLFLEGRKLLEGSINKDKQNAEYHFLRLIIQENCPAILQYYNKIDDDVLIVRQSFNLFTAEVKTAITNYSKTSKALNIKDLN